MGFIGGCNCGAVKYSIDEVERILLCSCDAHIRLTGSLLTGLAIIKDSAFRIIPVIDTAAVLFGSEPLASPIPSASSDEFPASPLAPLSTTAEPALSVSSRPEISFSDLELEPLRVAIPNTPINPATIDSHVKAGSQAVQLAKEGYDAMLALEKRFEKFKAYRPKSPVLSGSASPKSLEVYLPTFKDGNSVVQTWFCSNCGTTLWRLDPIDEFGVRSVLIGTLDNLPAFSTNLGENCAVMEQWLGAEVQVGCGTEEGKGKEKEGEVGRERPLSRSGSGSSFTPLEPIPEGDVLATPSPPQRALVKAPVGAGRSHILHIRSRSSST